VPISQLEFAAIARPSPSFDGDHAHLFVTEKLALLETLTSNARRIQGVTATTW
jgi:hypothetical protein